MQIAGLAGELEARYFAHLATGTVAAQEPIDRNLLLLAVGQNYLCKHS